MTPHHASTRAFHAALTACIKAEAKQSGRQTQTVMQDFLHQRILARLFDPAGQPEEWILKGGTGILVRIPTARPTDDLDLQHASDDAQATETALRAALERRKDPIRFTIRRINPLNGATPGQRIQLEASVGARRLDNNNIRIDVVHSFQHLTPDVEQLTPVITIDDVTPAPPVRLYPLDRQIADKVCALYETHGIAASSRYHDLVDLVLIITNCVLPEAARTAAAIASEAARRNLQLPRALISPSPSWSTGYRATAAKSPLPAALRTLDAALDCAGAYLNPILEMVQSGSE